MPPAQQIHLTNRLQELRRLAQELAKDISLELPLDASIQQGDGSEKLHMLNGEFSGEHWEMGEPMHDGELTMERLGALLDDAAHKLSVQQQGVWRD